MVSPSSAFLRLILAGLAALAVASASAAQGPEPKPVGTETITVPPDDAEPDVPDAASPTTPADLPMETPTVVYEIALLPPPVRRLREQIIAAAQTGDPESLRAVFEANGEIPELGSGEADDPVAHLASLSGDPEGREILAILIEVFEAGYVHVDAGTPDEMYVWPYFARYPVDKLTPPQLVELFKLVYAGDYEDMLAYGLYTSFRAGITPQGVWKFFFTD